MGDTNVIFSFFDNVFMRPGALFESWQNHYSKLTTKQKNDLINDLNKANLPTSKTTNLNNDEIKNFILDIFKNKLLKDLGTAGIISTPNKWFFINPATLVDPQSGGNELVIVDFNKNLGEFSNQLDVNLSLELYSIYDDKNKNPLWKDFNNRYTIQPTSQNNPNLNDIAVYSKLYRLMLKDGNGKNTKNIMQKIYKDHFDRICNNDISNLGTFSDNDINDLNIEKYNNIKFEMVLGEKFNIGKLTPSGKLTPVLLISYFTNNLNQQNQQKPNIAIYAVDFTKLGESGRIKKYITMIQTGNEFPYNSIGTGGAEYKKYEQIWQILNNAKMDRFNPIKKLADRIHNLIFYRLLYTFKSIGDHGQVNFAKELQELDFKREKYEVVFVTGDSLAALYASTKKVTNISAHTQSDFPSKYYCKSDPSGLIYYGNKTKTTLESFYNTISKIFKLNNG